MQIRLKDLTSKTLSIEEEIPAARDTKTFGARLKVISSVKVKLELNRSGEKVSVRGTAETTIQLRCSRCLENFPYHVDTDVDVVYQPVGAKRKSRTVKDAKVGKTGQLKEEDLKIATYTEPVLDLDEQITDAMNLAIPMKPLCREECQGLCPRCGQNLNIESCDCVRRSIDPRLAGLTKLLERNQDKS